MGLCEDISCGALPQLTRLRSPHAASALSPSLHAPAGLNFRVGNHNAWVYVRI